MENGGGEVGGVLEGGGVWRWKEVDTRGGGGGGGVPDKESHSLFVYYHS